MYIKTFFKKTNLLFVLLLSASGMASAKPVLNIQHWQTTNGVPVYFVQATELPMVDIDVVFDAGSSRDGQQPGLAQMTSFLLNDGTTTLNANQIANLFDSVGATFNTNVQRDMAIVSLRSLTDPHYLTPALQLFTQILTAPSFPQDQLTRTQQQVLVALKQQDQLPNTLAIKVLFAGLYGTHPYSHPILGNPSVISQITRNDLLHFYQTYYVAKNALIIIVGHLTKPQAEGIANQVMAKLPAGTSPAPVTKPPFFTQVKQRTIHFPSEQTHILVGQVIPLNYANPDYFALLLDNYILGGSSLNSQLFQQIRAQRGLAYNVASYLIPFSSSGLYLINLQTRNDKASAALDLAHQTLANFVAKGPSEKELRAAQNNAINGFSLQLASNSAIASNVITIAFYHLPLDYLDTYIKNIKAVTLEKAKNALQKYLYPQRMLTVTVGNNEKPPKKPA
ncbi:MAG: pitrilysin family protein [Gammaproteobacteria bacterium]